MRELTRSDVKYAEGIAYRTSPVKDFDHPIFKECMSAAWYGLADAARKFNPAHPRANWAAFRALRVWGEVRQVIRTENAHGNIGLSNRGRGNKDMLTIYGYNTVLDAIESLYENSSSETSDSADCTASEDELLNETNPESELLERERKAVINEIIELKLSALEGQILREYYWNDKTAKEISKMIHKTEEETQEILIKASECVKKALIVLGYSEV